MSPGSKVGGIKMARGSSYRRFFFILGVFALIFYLGTGTVFGAQSNESTGPSGYGWQQVYEVYAPSTGSATRLTGTADRAMYDYGFKPIQISGRKENYWSRDCGWWYVSGESNLNVAVFDGAGDTVNTSTSISTTKGRATVTLPWGSDDDPGEWTARVDDGVVQASFKFYVRGRLMVDSFLVTPAHPEAGDNTVVEAIIKDNAGNVLNRSVRSNNGTLVPFNVTGVVSGAGEYFQLNFTDDGSGFDLKADDGIWTANFTPSAMGDHKVKAKASDDHVYWVDGSGFTTVNVGGSFPYASVVLPFFEGVVGRFSSSFGIQVLLGFLGGLGGVFVLRRRWLHG